jgi:hypothetical protein
MRGYTLVGLFAMLLLPATAHAESPGAAVAATQHALEEQANACAQRKKECWTPTATPTGTATPRATLVATATPTLAPAVPATASPTPTPEPCWLTDDNGEVVFDADGTPLPCPEPSQDLLPESEEPALTPEPDPPAVVLTPVRPPSASAPSADRAIPASAPSSTPQPLPTYTPYPTYTPQLTYTPAPTLTATPGRTPTLTATPSVSPTATATATATVTPVPLGEAAPPEVRAALNVPWLTIAATLSGIALLMALVGAVVVIKRRRLVRKPRPPREDAYA